MTVIRPNSISGVTSITAQGDTLTLYKSDGTNIGQLDVNVYASSGVSTIANLNVIGGNVGIGTDNPDTSYRVTIKSSTSPHSALLLDTTESDYNTNLYFAKQGTNKWIIGNIATDDSFRFVAGSTERLRINSSGRVGINTNAINANLEVHTAASKINTQTIKTSAGAGGYAGLAFMAGQTSAGREKAALYFQETNNGAHYTGDLVFALNNDSGSAVQVSTSDERMRITSSGNVGIGTDNPTAKLAIRGSENTVVEIQPDIPSGASRILSFNRVSNAYRTLRLDGSEMKLETSSVPKLRIAANGNIGIGDDFDANNYARLSVYEDNYTYGRSLAPTSTGQYASSYSPPVGTFYYRNNTDSGAIGVRHYVQAEQGYPNAQGYLDVLIKNSGFYTIRIKASTGSTDAAVATMLVYGLANSTNTNHPVVSITGASGSGTSNPTFASGHGKGSSNAVATFWWEVLNYNVNTYDCTMRIHTTHSNNQGLRAIIEECVG